MWKKKYKSLKGKKLFKIKKMKRVKLSNMNRKTGSLILTRLRSYRK